MTERDTNKPTSQHPLDDDRPLGLADTDQPDAQASTPSSSPTPHDTRAAAKEASRRRAESARSRSSTGSRTGTGGASGSDTRGKSTSFETMLGKAVVDRGLASDDEIELCRAIQSQSAIEGDPRQLADILIENEFLTGKQVERLRRDFEDEKTTQQIPGYKILKKLGSGAMATVFLGRQLSLDRLVAIKVLPIKFSSNEKFIERFYKEGRAAAQLNHRNIVSAYDVGQAGDHHYFVMEFVDGDTVYDRVKAKKRFDEKEAIDVILQVARALEHAHAKGFIHRDIKPKNIMLSKDSQVKLADLGLARAVSDKEAAEAEAGRAYGTPYYISPEQIRGEVNIGGQADIYGLGATFYHMVTGKVPFEGKNPSAVMHKHLKNPLTPPDHVNTKLTPGTAQVIEMMMAKSRKDRYRNVDDLIVDLEHLRKGESPHFAQSRGVNTDIASQLEEHAQSAPVALQKRSTGPRMPAVTSHPLFIGAVAVAALSLVINLVLIGIVLSDSPAGPGGGAGAGGGAVVTPAPTLIGNWESVSISGDSLSGIDHVEIAFGSDSTGTLVTTTGDQSTRYPFTYTRSGNSLDMRFGNTPVRYTYTLTDGQLAMNRNDGTGRIVLVRQ